MNEAYIRSQLNKIMESPLDSDEFSGSDEAYVTDYISKLLNLYPNTVKEEFVRFFFSNTVNGIRKEAGK